MSSATEVISQEIIKPTIQTANQFKNFNLSLLDQYFRPAYVPIILFYPASTANSTAAGGKHHDDDIGLLKSSLSETLVHFYPMAGRLKDNIVIDCNDEGIEFLEVKIDVKMCDFMAEPDVPISQLLPPKVVSTNFVEEAQVIVQVNMFDCGGTAICLCISHKIADLCTMSTFIRSWSATTNKNKYGGAVADPTTDQNLRPSFDSASLFPPSERLASPSGMPPTPVSYPVEDSKGDKIVSKRFVFDAVKIKSVREKLQVLMQDKYRWRMPTRVEVVSALIWKSAMKFVPAGSLLTVKHAVNFRKKMNPPLQNVSFGNLCVVVAAVVPTTTASIENSEDGEVRGTSTEVQVVLDELNDFVAQLRGEIDKVKGDKVCMEKIFLNFINGCYDSMAKHNDASEDEVIDLWMTSWCKFGLYDADFGWGKPIWVTTYVERNKNLIVMNDTECGEGIEVWANFLKNDMAKFELHLSEILELI